MSYRIFRMSIRYLPNEKQPPMLLFKGFQIFQKKHLFIVLVSNESSKCQNDLYVDLCIDEDVCTRCTKRRCHGWISFGSTWGRFSYPVEYFR